MYPNGKSPKLGTKLDASDVKQIPTILFGNEVGAKYVVLMFGKSQHPLYFGVRLLETRDTGIEYFGYQMSFTLRLIETAGVPLLYGYIL